MKVAAPETNAPVTVVMPEVKLTIEDLSYMTGLLPGAMRCRSGGKTTDRLVFLGLIEMATIPPCPKALEAYQKKQSDAKKGIREAIKEGNWYKVHDLSSMFKWTSDQPKETKDYILTASGREFMQKGRAQSITSKKAGCVQ